MKRTLRWLVSLGAVSLVLALSLAFAACGDDGSSSGVQDTRDDEALHVEGDVRQDEALHVEGDEPEDGADGDVQEVSVATSDLFRYEPGKITVKVGEPVRITLDNSGGVILHDFTVEGLPADDVSAEGTTHGHEDAMVLHVAAKPASTGILEFTPTEPGEYVFYCTVPGHREAGMEGKITVEAA